MGEKGGTRGADPPKNTPRTVRAKPSTDVVAPSAESGVAPAESGDQARASSERAGRAEDIAGERKKKGGKGECVGELGGERNRTKKRHPTVPPFFARFFERVASGADASERGHALWQEERGLMR